MDELTLDEALEGLESAEDFLDYFGIAFKPSVVHVNRLHILQRFHDYLARAGGLPEGEAARRAAYRGMLEQAYQDFLHSDALTEKVFKVFHMHEPQTAFVPLAEIKMAKRSEAEPEQSAGCGGSCSGSGAYRSSEAALRAG
jgi:nitrogenase-stabilizing/protective protein